MSIRHTGRFLKFTYGKELTLANLYNTLKANFNISYLACLACDNRTYVIIDFGYKINITSYKKVVYENSVPIIERIEDFKVQQELLETKGVLYTGPSLPDIKTQEIIEDLSKKKCISCEKNMSISYFSLKSSSCKYCEKAAEYQLLSKKSKSVQKLKQIDPDGVLEPVIMELIELHNAPLIEENKAIKEELEKSKKHMTTMLKNISVINNALFRDGLLNTSEINKNSGFLILDICDAHTFANYNNVSLTYRTFKRIPDEELLNKRVIFLDYVLNKNRVIDKFKSFAHVDRTSKKYMDEFKVVLFQYIQPELWDVAKRITNKITAVELYHNSIQVANVIAGQDIFLNGEVRICSPEILNRVMCQLKDFVVLCPTLQTDLEESLSILHPEVKI